MNNVTFRKSDTIVPITVLASSHYIQNPYQEIRESQCLIQNKNSLCLTTVRQILGTIQESQLATPGTQLYSYHMPSCMLPFLSPSQSHLPARYTRYICWWTPLLPALYAFPLNYLYCLQLRFTYSVPLPLFSEKLSFICVCCETSICQKLPEGHYQLPGCLFGIL